jgi:hypothetical protein
VKAKPKTELQRISKAFTQTKRELEALKSSRSTRIPLRRVLWLREGR